MPTITFSTSKSLRVEITYTIVLFSYFRIVIMTSILHYCELHWASAKLRSLFFVLDLIFSRKFPFHQNHNKHWLLHYCELHWASANFQSSFLFVLYLAFSRKVPFHQNRNNELDSLRHYCDLHWTSAKLQSLFFSSLI